MQVSDAYANATDALDAVDAALAAGADVDVQALALLQSNALKASLDVQQSKQRADDALSAVSPILIVFGITIIVVSMQGALALWKRVRTAAIDNDSMYITSVCSAVASSRCELPGVRTRLQSKADASKI